MIYAKILVYIQFKNLSHVPLKVCRFKRLSIIRLDHKCPFKIPPLNFTKVRFGLNDPKSFTFEQLKWHVYRVF
jgi:hypothetical protein